MSIDITFEDAGSHKGADLVNSRLVDLYDFQQASAFNKSSTHNEELTTLVSALLDMDLNPHESELVADVLINLMRQAETHVRQALSERLSVMDTVPLRLALHMASDSIDIAEPILKNSPVFSDMDLIYIIKSKPADYWRAIAQRKELGETVVNSLASCGDMQTSIYLVENQDITLGETALDSLAFIASEEEAICKPLLQRDEVTDELIQNIYKGAGIGIKHYIQDSFGETLGGIAATEIDAVMKEFFHASTPEQEQQSPGEKHLKIAQYYKERGELTVEQILITLKRGQLSLSLAELSVFFDVPLRVIEELAVQDTGQGLAILCNTKELGQPDFISMYLLINRVSNNGEMINPKKLNRAIEYFERIDETLAKQLLDKAVKNAHL